jgi:SAM-dependent methyltransferase
VLDVGCGTGNSSAIAASHVREVVAIEVSEETVVWAGAKHHLDNLTFMTMPATELSLPDAYFDATCSIQVIECIRLPRSIVASSGGPVDLAHCASAVLEEADSSLKLLFGREPLREWEASAERGVLARDAPALDPPLQSFDGLPDYSQPEPRAIQPTARARPARSA